jgi:hypothetical protein
MITAEGLRAELSYDPASGVFTWLAKPSRRVRAGAVAVGGVFITGIEESRLAIDFTQRTASRGCG